VPLLTIPFQDSTSKAASGATLLQTSAEKVTAAEPTVLCVGEILIDAIETRDAQGAAAGPPELLAGGAPANVAIALRKLGVPSAFVGCVGADAVGDDLIARLRAAGVNLAGIQRTHDAPTRIVRVLCDAQGERTFIDFGGAPADSFADARLRAQGLPTDLLTNIGLVVIGSLSQAYPQSRAAIVRILRDARDRAIPVLLDVNRRPMFWPGAARRERERTSALAAFAAYVKLSVEEAQWLYGAGRAEEIALIATRLRGVVVTDGPRALTYHIDGVSGTLLPPKMTAVDTTGAGDAFTAGWIARLLTSKTPVNAGFVEESMRYASVVGALATTGVGAWSALPTRAQAETYLAHAADKTL
jgi:fructokinase